MEKFDKLYTLSRIVAVAGKSEIIEKDFDFLPEGYKLMHIAKNTECGEYKHHALAIYNENEKEVIFANYGTHVDLFDISTTFQDIYADTQLSLKGVPSKFSSTAKFIDQTLELLGNKDYKITCTGHSLGGFLAQLGGAFCKSKGFNDVKVVAFDSPGAKEATQKLASQLKFTGDINKDVENYLTKPNIVNSTNSHLGKILYIPKLEQNSQGEPHDLVTWLGKFTGLSKLFSGINNHMLWNFTNFFDLNNGTDARHRIIEAQNWDGKNIYLSGTEELDRIKALNPEYIKFNRETNGANPEYVSSNDIEDDVVCVEIYDQNDIVNFCSMNYDNDA